MSANGNGYKTRVLRSAEAMMNEATSEVGGYGRFAGGGDFEWHFEEGEICGLTNRKLFLGRMQDALENTAKSGLHMNGGQLESAWLEGLCRKSLVQCLFKGTHKMVVQILSKIQDLKGGIRVWTEHHREQL